MRGSERPCLRSASPYGPARCRESRGAHSGVDSLSHLLQVAHIRQLSPYLVADTAASILLPAPSGVRRRS